MPCTPPALFFSACFPFALSLSLSSVGPMLCALLNTILVAVSKAKLLLFPLQKFSFRKFCAFVLENWQQQHQHVWSVHGLPLPVPVPVPEPLPLTNHPTATHSSTLSRCHQHLLMSPETCLPFASSFFLAFPRLTG